MWSAFPDACDAARQRQPRRIDEVTTKACCHAALHAACCTECSDDSEAKIKIDIMRCETWNRSCVCVCLSICDSYAELVKLFV